MLAFVVKPGQAFGALGFVYELDHIRLPLALHCALRSKPSTASKFHKR
jgi:hypothetical protein